MKEEKDSTVENTASMSNNSSLKRQWTKIAGVVSAYWVVSISMVFLNKYLLSSEDLKLHAPVFITLSQCIIALLSFNVLGYSGQYCSDIVTFPKPEYSLSTILKMAPLSIVFVGMITFNNLTLKFLGVAFYNVGRSLTTVFNVLLTFIVLREQVSLRIIGCCGFIVAGFLFGVKEEDKLAPEMNFLGILCGIIASLCVALYAIFIKRSLPIVDNNVWRLQIYSNLNACILLFPAMIVMGEVPVLIEFKFWTSPSFWLILMTSGVFGIGIGYVSSLQIKFTSPLTHNVSGTAKACAQTLLACLIYSESKTLWWWMCNFFVLGGSLAYAYFRSKDMERTAAAATATTTTASNTKLHEARNEQ